MGKSAVSNRVIHEPFHCRPYLVAGIAHEKHLFTDLAGFTLRCLVCGEGITGEKHVQSHALATGHTNFAEYKKNDN